MKQSSTFKRILVLFSQHKIQVGMILLLSVCQVGLTLYIPILLGQVIDVAIGYKNVQFNIISQRVIQMLIVILLNTIIQWVVPRLYTQLVFQIMTQLRATILNKIHHLPLSYLDTLSTGDLVSRVVSDVQQLNDGILLVFNQFFVGVLTILVTIVTMGLLDWKMLLLVLALTPLTLILARFIASRSYTLFKKQTTDRGKYTQVVEENIQQVKVIRSFDAQDKVSKLFQEINDEYASSSQQAIFISSITNPTTRFINAIIYSLLTLIGANRIIQGTFTVGDLTIFLNYVVQYTKPFNDISSVLSEIQGAFASAERLYDILDQVEFSETGNKKIDSVTLAGNVTFDNISFSYVPEQSLIEHFTVEITAGQKVAIVGPTGAGKSTLINLLMRFYEVNNGVIRLDGIPITEYTVDSLRENFGMVLQETWLKTGTVHDNIAYGYPQAARQLVIEAAKAAHAHHFIMQLPQGYDTNLEDAGDSLSIGQQQLLSIARLFVKIPQLLILDEATSSIDTRTELLIQQAFNQLMKDRTSFIIAHRLSTIQSADLILVMQNGAIIEQGNHEGLMRAKGLYYQMQQTRR